jgi:anaerobic magnesium-protoporphyrin IX monomethyl ester cyclase
MRILLVNPGTNLRPGLRTCAFFPEGLIFLAAVLEKSGHEVQIYDNDIDQRKPADFLTFKPSLIGYSVLTTTSIPLAIDQSREFRVLFPRAKIVWGNVHPSLAPEGTIKEDYIDYLVIGAGEEPIIKLVSHLETGVPGLKDIPGLVYKEREKILINTPASELKNLDELPDPAWHLIEINKYWAFSLSTSRGCPFSCTFCYNSAFHAGQRGEFSAERIINQVQYLQESYGVRYIRFFEDNFTFNRERLRAFCQSVVDRRIKLKWDCESRADLSESDIALMAKAGCISVWLGVESGSKRLLNFLKKGINLDVVQETFWNLVKYRIIPHIYIMEAVPTETIEDFKLTQKLLHKLDDPPFTYARFVPYPGTPLYNYCVDNRLITPPGSLAEWAPFVSYHYTQANLSQVPDEIINEAFEEWSSSRMMRSERFKQRHNL